MKKITLLSCFIISLNLLFAQFPGGVSSSNTNRIWLDANQLSASNGQLIQTWTDVSGNGANANQVIAAKRPLYKTNAINGMPALDFDGTNDYMFISANPALNSNLSTHFIVFDKSTLNSGNNMMFNMDFSEASNLIFSYATPTYLASYVKNSSGSPRYATSGVPTSSMFTSYLWNGNTGVYQNYVNGNAGSFATGANNTATSHNLTRIGAFNTNYRFNGDIAEIIYYTSVLNSAEKNIVENYLAAKYQIPIAIDLYSHESTHRNEVIGIGQEADGSNLSASGTNNLTISATSMNNGDYVFAGHDNGGFGNNTTDVPSGYSRYNQVWRSTLTNYAGLVDIAFDVSTLGLGNDTSYKLLVDADGVFASGATEYSGVFAGGIVTFTGVTLTSTSFFTLANSDFAVLSTGVTNDWHLTTTWNCGCIPSLGSDVLIQPGHNVFINGQNAQAGNLTIDGSLSFNSDDTLQVNQDLTNNGTFTAGLGTVNFEGSLNAHNSNGIINYYSLILDHSLGLTLNGATSVQGWLDVVNGTLTTNNNLTLLSNATGTAAYYRPSGSEISGDVTVERFLNEGESYYLLGTVVSNGTLEDWNQEAEMQGFTGTEWPGGVSSVYYFDQNNISTNYNEGYTVPNSTFDIVDPKIGYEIYVGDDTKATGARTIDVTGSIVTGSVVYSLPHIVRVGTPADDGWSLITNPYPAPVKFGYVLKGANFDKAYVKRANGTRPSINNQWVLGSGEAFYVHANVGGSSLTFQPWMAGFDEDITDTYNLRSTTSVNNEPILAIELEYTHNNNIEQDYAYVGFSDNATDVKDDLDAYKWNNIYTDKPNLSSTNNGNKLETNILSMNNSSIIPLNIIVEYPSSVVKNYTLSFSNVSDLLYNNKKLVLEDRSLSVFIELTEDTSYSFTMMDSITQSRFFLHVSSPLTSIKNDVTCFGSNDAKIIVDGYNGDSKGYVWKDQFNNVIASSSNVFGADSLTNIGPGIYSVEVTNLNSSETVVNTFVVEEPNDIVNSFFTLFDNNGKSDLVSSIDNDTLDVFVGMPVEFQNNSENTTSYLWNFGDLTTSNLEHPTHTYFNTGVYKVELTSQNTTCNKVSEQYVNVVNATGIVETNLLDKIIVYNNDDDLFITFNNNNPQNFNIKLLNNLGQEVINKNVFAVEGQQEIMEINAASGVYIVSVSNDQFTKTEKIVISNK